MPADDVPVYDDALRPGWRVTADGGAELIDRTTAVAPFGGDGAMEVRGNPTGTLGWRIDFEPEAPVDPKGYALHLALHPGDLTAGRRSRLAVQVNDSRHAIDLLFAGLVDLERREWQIVSLPMEATFDVEQVESITIKGTLAGTFYVDDLRLDTPYEPAAATAVVEERGSRRPTRFALRQNAPNPFNPRTTIRFDLHTGSTVDLAVFDLLGQRVVSLASGWREAGAYVVHWDGRTAGGHELASGVYLYRLQAAGQAVTRKLTLLR